MYTVEQELAVAVCDTVLAQCPQRSSRLMHSLEVVRHASPSQLDPALQELVVSIKEENSGATPEVVDLLQMTVHQYASDKLMHWTPRD